MKHYILSLGAIVFLSTSAFENSHSVNLNRSLAIPQAITEFTAAVKVSETQFQTLTANYQTNNPDATLGGAMSKEQVQALINSMPSGSTYVQMKFCKDAQTGKTSLILAGDKKWYQNSDHVKYVRNGGSEDAFCPMMCDNPSNIDNITLNISKEDFTQLTAEYKMANPTGTFGGRIDKTAIQEILNSLEPETAVVKFRFCADAATGKTSVIFIGGKVGQNDYSNLYYRNGKNADAFCPMMCD